MISEMSTADTGSVLKTDTRQRGADRSHEDERKLKAVSTTMSDYV